MVIIQFGSHEGIQMRIVVVGDVVVDHHVYEGERSTPAATQSRGVRVVREYGGAHSLFRLLSAVLGASQNRVQTAEAQCQQGKLSLPRSLRLKWNLD